MLAVLILGLPSVDPAAILAAQDCTTFVPPCPNDDAPTITFIPVSGSVFTGADSIIEITVLLYDDHALNVSTYSAQLSGMTGGSVGEWDYPGPATGRWVFQVHLASGSGNSITISVCDYSSHCPQASASYTYTPPPPPPIKATPFISLGPYNDESQRPGPFDVSLSYATPSYVSLDVPRSVRLVYATALEVPEATVQVDVFDNSQTVPQEMSIKVRHGGALQDLLGLAAGQKEQFYAGANGTTRLAARFSTAALGVGAYNDSVEVASIWPEGPIGATALVRVLVARDITSPYGRGWSVAGLQRLVVTNDGVVISEGDGSIGFFKTCSSSCFYQSPKGDFSVLEVIAEGWRRRYPDGTKAEFNSSGRLTKIEDRYGNATLFGYDGSNRLNTITDPANLVTTLSYDWNGKLDWIRDPFNRTTQITVDASSDLTEIWDPDGVRAMQITYANHVPQSWVSRTGGLYHHLRDYVGRRAVDSLPHVRVELPFLQARPVLRYRSIESQVLPLGDGYGTSAQPLPNRQTVSLRAATFAPNGDSTVYALNRFGQATKTGFRDPQGAWREATASFNEYGQPLLVESLENSSTSHSWSGPNLIQLRDNNANSVTDYTYDSTFNQVTSVTVGGLLIQQNFYNASNGRLDSTKVGSSKTVFTYDARGRRLTATDPNGHVATTTYHGSGTQNTNTITAPTGNGSNGTVTREYDGYGRIWRVTDPANRQVTTTYDLLNRVDSTIAPGNLRIKYGYNDATRTYTVRDPKGQVYTSIQNGLGWVETRKDQRNSEEQYAYNVSGGVTTYVNRRNQTVSFTHDLMNRVLTSTADGLTTTWSYDSLGRWMTVSNGESLDTLKFDAKRRLTEAVTVRNGVTYRVQSTYTQEGQRNAVTAKRDGGWTSDFGFGYDALYRFNWLGGFTPLGTSLTYTSEQLPYEITLPTGTGPSDRLKQTFTYTASHLVNWFRFNKASVDSTQARTYSYDALGRLISSVAGVYGPDHVAREIQYDAAGRLEKYADVHHWQEGQWVCDDPFNLETCHWDTTYHADTIRTETFAYDSASNRTDHGAVIENGNRVTSFDGYTMTYDGDGNMLTKNKPGVWSQSFTWNSLGQLTQVVTNGTTTTFGYDGLGRRIRKTTGGVTTRYLHDDDDLVAELDGSGNLVREYAYYPGVDRPHSVRRASDGQVFYYATEQPSHVSGLVNSSNQVVNQYQFTPWGEAITTSEQVPQPLRYTAREYDVETGLYSHRARHYDPKLGRYISEDPIGLAGGLNSFAYVGNDPVNFDDPSGLICRPSRVTLTNEETGETRTVDGLRCENLTPGDFRTIRRYLNGGAAHGPGDNVYATFSELGMTQWSEATCRGGFDVVQCEAIAETQARLILHEDPFCSDLGVRGSQRFARRMYRYHEGLIPYRRIPFIGRLKWAYGMASYITSVVTLSSEVFLIEALLYDTIVHEEEHLRVGIRLMDLFDREAAPTAAEARCA